MKVYFDQTVIDDEYSVDGSFIMGNELVSELSTNKEIITIDNKRYYCQYYYVTLPNGNKVKTDNYVLGDEIVTPVK